MSSPAVADPAPSGGAVFSLRPLMAAAMACTMTMMAFVAMTGPLSRVLGLQAWQAGAAVTVGGVLWMLLARVWGVASDRHGRRPVLLGGVMGFIVCYWAMCAVLLTSLAVLPAAGLVFAGLLITRGALGGFYGAIPAVGQALVADHVPPQGRASAMAGLGAANAVGMVVGPALAGVLSQYSLGLPLYVTAVLPVLALVVLWRTLPATPPRAGTPPPPLRLTDVRLRRPMTVAFLAMFCVSIAQITVGFFAIDRLGLTPEAGARTAGVALTLVGVGLILSQAGVRRLGWTPNALIRRGALLAAFGFGSGMLVDSAWMLGLCYFVAACGMGCVFPAFAALASNAVTAREQGAAAGSIGAAQGLGMVLGPMVGTAVYAFGPGVPYAVSAVLLVGIALWPARQTPPAPPEASA